MVNTVMTPKADIVSDRWVKATWDEFRILSEDPDYAEMASFYFTIQ